MDNWSLCERDRILIAAFTTIVVVVAFVIEEFEITGPTQYVEPSGTSTMSDLISVVREMANAIKNPVHWTDILYNRVMEVDGFKERELVEVLDYLQGREAEARGFMVRKLEHRKDWIHKFLSRMGFWCSGNDENKVSP